MLPGNAATPVKAIAANKPWKVAQLLSLSADLLCIVYRSSARWSENALITAAAPHGGDAVGRCTPDTVEETDRLVPKDY